MKRVIAHFDVNYFYAQIEIMQNPKLRGYHVAVGGDVESRHGICLAATPEAKKMGVKVGMALHEAKALCPKIIFLPPNYELYMQVSRDFKTILSDYTDTLESFGLDESWGDFTYTWQLFAKSPYELGDMIRQRVYNELGLTISTGLSYNKIFAKLASDMKKPYGLVEITTENYKELAWPLPAQDLLYVGRQTQMKLNSRCVHTIGDIARTTPGALRGWLGKWGTFLHQFANGQDASPVQKSEDEDIIKSVGNSWTTPRDLKNETDCLIVFQGLAESVGTRLRELGLMCKTIQIDLRDTGLITIQRQHTFSTPTYIAAELCGYRADRAESEHDAFYRHPACDNGRSGAGSGKACPRCGNEHYPMAEAAESEQQFFRYRALRPRTAKERKPRVFE